MTSTLSQAFRLFYYERLGESPELILHSPKDETPHQVNWVRPLLDQQVDRTHVEAQQCVELSGKL
jgi:hypothetical protein